MIPAWLRHRLAGQAHRAAALRLCQRCHRPVLVGLDADNCALTATCDPIALTPLGEAVALLTGRATYALTPGQDRKELDYRDEWRIANPTKNPVLAAHHCNGIDLTPFAQPAPAPKQKEAANAKCPY